MTKALIAPHGGELIINMASEKERVKLQRSPQAIMTIEEKYGYDKQLEASKIYRTLEEVHPGVEVLYQQGDILLSGSLCVIALQKQAFAQYRFTPTRSRQMFTERGWERIVGFQTRNPVHRAHEYVL